MDSQGQGNGIVNTGSKKFSVLRNGILLLLALAIAGGTLEIGGRLIMRSRFHRMLVTFPALGWTDVHRYDPDLMWSLKPNVKNAYQIMTQDNPIQSPINTNDLGLRNPPIGEKGPRRRILALGCSTTFGAGVGDSDAWPAVLQTLLDLNVPGQYEVINAGVSAYSAYQGLVYLEKRGIALAPDIVIVCFGQNDHSEVPENGLHDLEWYNPEETSGIVLLAREALKGAGILRTEPRLAEKRCRLSYGQFTDVMLRIGEVCSEHHALCSFLIWPYECHLGVDATAPPYSLIRAVANYRSAQVIDLFDMIRESKDKLYYDGLHMTVLGNRLVARKVATDLKLVQPTAEHPLVETPPAEHPTP